MNELDILNHFQLSFISNATYMLSFTGLVFITFRLVRFQREQNSNVFGKILVTIFGLCTAFYGYTVFSYLRNAQLAQSYRLSELKESGVELSTVTNSFIEFTGHSVSDGWPPSSFNACKIVWHSSQLLNSRGVSSYFSFHCKPARK